jgi:dolichol-phosphate mannosyltransferase
MRDNELLGACEIAAQTSPVNLADSREIKELADKPGQGPPGGPRGVSRPAGWPGDRCRAPALSVIVPTRNEADNIRPLLAGLGSALAGIDAEVLIVDDSDDATPEIARQSAALSVLPIRVRTRPPGQRTGGLGGAVLMGLSAALGPVCVVMDADLQHPPELLGMLLRVSRTGVDFVVASRYRDGGAAEGLGGWYRRAVSTLATRVAKRVLRPELTGVSDPMSGFFLVRRSCLDLPLLRPQGFKLLLELLVHSPQASVAEVPYTFGVRHSGASKAGAREGLTYLRRLTQLRAQARRAPRKSRPQQVPVRGPGAHRRRQPRAGSGQAGSGQASSGGAR